MLSLLLSIIGRLLTCSLGSWLIYAIVSRIIPEQPAHLPLSIAFASPLWMVSFAKFVMPALSAFKNQAKYHALAPLSGRNYAFGSHRLRLYLVDEVIWIPAADVAPLLAPPADARELRYLGADYGNIPGQKLVGYTEAGLLRLLTTRNATRRATHDMIRFKHWLEKEAFPNLRRVPGSTF